SETLFACTGSFFLPPQFRLTREAKLQRQRGTAWRWFAWRWREIRGSKYRRWRFLGPAFHIPSIRCATSSIRSIEAIPFFLSSALMLFRKSAHGRILPRFFHSVTSL